MIPFYLTVAALAFALACMGMRLARWLSLKEGPWWALPAVLLWSVVAGLGALVLGCLTLVLFIAITPGEKEHHR